MFRNPFSFFLGLLEAARLRAEHAHSEVGDDDPQDVELADATPDTQRPKFLAIEAWCGWESLRNPDRDVAFAKRIGLKGLEIIINDHSKDRLPRPYDTRDVGLIETLVDKCYGAGIRPAFMTWVMPHLEYIKGMGEQLVALCLSTGVKRVTLDAEEPWTLAKKAMKYTDAAAALKEHVIDKLHEIGVTVWVTGIRYAPTSKLRPLIDFRGMTEWFVSLARSRKELRARNALAAICDGGMPQCYATRTSKADPSTVAAKGVATWRSKFGKWLPFILAGAAYRQDGIKGHTTRSALVAFFDSAADFFEQNPQMPRVVILWGLNSIRRSPQIASVIQDIALEAAPPALVA